MKKIRHKDRRRHLSDSAAPVKPIVHICSISPNAAIAPSMTRSVVDGAITKLRMYDSIELDDAAGVKETNLGLTAKPRIARTGIQLYLGSECGRNDMDIVRVYRPPGAVFHKDALHSYTHIPLTLDHPKDGVTKDNWKQLATGEVHDEVLRDGDSVRVPILIRDATAIKAYKNGVNQLSVGYDCNLIWQAGVTDDGEAYDAVQDGIIANHLAQVAAARGGSKLRIGDSATLGDVTMTTATPISMKTVLVDGYETQMPETAAVLVNRTIDNLQKQIAEMKVKDAKRDKDDEDDEKEMDTKDAAIKAKDAEIATLKKQLEDAKIRPEQLDALVTDRTNVLAVVKKIMGDRFVTDGKTINEIRRAVVEEKVSRDLARSWDDAQCTASFNTLVNTAVDPRTARHTSDGSIAHAATVFSGRPGGGYGMNDGSNGDRRQQAYQDYDRNMSEAWRNPSNFVDDDRRRDSRDRH